MFALLAWQAFRVVGAMAAYEQGILAGAPGDIDAIVAAAFNLEVELEMARSTIQPFLRAEAGRALTAMQDQYGIARDLTVDADFIRGLLQAQESRFASDISATSIRGIRDQIAEGIANGEGHYQLRSRVLGYYERQAEWRAGLAAQYESGTAYEAVRDALAVNQGFTRHRWIDSGDADVCDICRGNTAAGWLPVDQAFPSGHRFPLAHPNCRCWNEYE